MDNFKEMDKFLETYNPTRLNQEERDNLKRLITSSEIEFVKRKKKKTSHQQKYKAGWPHSGILPNI